MRIFVTGATGFIGSALVPRLIGAGHQVIGLSRSDEGAARLEAAGAAVQRGTIEDIASVVAGVEQADAVVHLAFNHDFSRFVQNSEEDRALIEAMGKSIAGTGKPMLVTSGTAIAVPQPGEPCRETDPTKTSKEMPRAASEEAARAAIAAGANVGIVRLPQVHDPERQGLITYAVALAREKGVSAYVGEGDKAWPAAHVSDVAHLYRLAIERGESGAVYNAVAEGAVPFRAIAEAVGARLGLPVRSIAPEEAEAHFGWLAMFLGHNMSASSEMTRAKLGWEPTGPDLLSDLAKLPLEG